MPPRYHHATGTVDEEPPAECYTLRRACGCDFPTVLDPTREAGRAYRRDVEQSICHACAVQARRRFHHVQ